MAAQNGHIRACELLLEAGAVVDAVDRFLRTPLHLAVGLGHADTARLLLAAGASVDAVDHLGATPLHLCHPSDNEALLQHLSSRCTSAAELGGLSGCITMAPFGALDGPAVLPVVLGPGAAVSSVRDTLALGPTLLPVQLDVCQCHLAYLLFVAWPGYCACGAGSQQCAALMVHAAVHDFAATAAVLLAAGANVQALDSKQRTPLHAASGSYGARTHTVRAVPVSETVAESDGGAAAPLAVPCSDSASIVSSLLAAGAEVSARTCMGATPLHVAARQDDAAVMELLLDGGADVNARDVKGQTSLHIAVVNGCDAAVGVLLTAGASTTLESNNGDAALEVAVAMSHLRLLPPLLAAGAGADGICHRAAIIAAGAGDAPCLAALVRAGADVNGGPGHEGSPLAAAAASGRTRMVRQLLALGARVNGQCRGANSPYCGTTALGAATHKGRAETMLALLAAGAAPEPADASVISPLVIAVGRGLVEAVQMMLGADVSSMRSCCEAAVVDVGRDKGLTWGSTQHLLRHLPEVGPRELLGAVVEHVLLLLGGSRLVVVERRVPRTAPPLPPSSGEGSPPPDSPPQSAPQLSGSQAAQAGATKAAPAPSSAGEPQPPGIEQDQPVPDLDSEALRTLVLTAQALLQLQQQPQAQLQQELEHLVQRPQPDALVPVTGLRGRMVGVVGRGVDQLIAKAQPGALYAAGRLAQVLPPEARSRSLARLATAGGALDAVAAGLGGSISFCCNSRCHNVAAPTKRCGGCKLARFCDRECLAGFWQQHQPHCLAAASGSINAPQQ